VCLAAAVNASQPADVAAPIVSDSPIRTPVVPYRQFRRVVAPRELSAEQTDRPTHTPAGTAAEHAAHAPIYIGYFGPADIDDPRGGDAWEGALLAVEAMNADTSARRCELVPFWSPSPWNSAAADIAQAIHRRPLRAVIGGIDGESLHLAATIATKARVLLLSGCSTDKSAVLSGVPWVFSCLPDDGRIASSFVQTAAAHKWRTVWILSDSSHDSRTFCRELENALNPRETRLLRKFVVGQSPLSHEILTALSDDAPDVVVVSADPSAAASWVDGLRHADYAGAVFVGPLAMRRRFFENATDDLGNVWGPRLVEQRSDDSFARRFRQRFGRMPDATAYGTYDAVCLAITALRKHGDADCLTLSRYIRRQAPYHGVSGKLIWDTAGSVVRDVPLHDLVALKSEFREPPAH
ncbi:MAG: hypothetical protein D6741_16590, partial [Planctomycetota bacterium]